MVLRVSLWTERETQPPGRQHQRVKSYIPLLSRGRGHEGVEGRPLRRPPVASRGPPPGCALDRGCGSVAFHFKFLMQKITHSRQLCVSAGSIMSTLAHTRCNLACADFCAVSWGFGLAFFLPARLTARFSLPPSKNIILSIRIVYLRIYYIYSL